jgi:hypothetical protein
MLRSIFYLAFATLAMSGLLGSQASAGKSGPSLYQFTATGKHIPQGTIKARTTTGSSGPNGNVGASPRDAGTGLPSGKRH